MNPLSSITTVYKLCPFNIVIMKINLLWSIYIIGFIRLFLLFFYIRMNSGERYAIISVVNKYKLRD